MRITCCLLIAAEFIAWSAVAVAQNEDQIHVADGFAIERVYQVPRQQGSWVSLTTDDRGRLISSAQEGSLYRITPGAQAAQTKVEQIPLDIGFAQGLLYAFDSLYVVAHGNQGRPSGLFRVRDLNGDDVFDSMVLLRAFEGSGEHGPHAVILGPDKKSLLVCAGNHTNLPHPETSLVPRLWKEDQLLPRISDPGGHAVGRMAPGGWICRTDPDGKSFELIADGFRNTYDIALDPNGELFTYDADMEWDIGTPWYRPTRVCHVTPGSEFGWRNGNYKWPPYYGDSLPSALDIGPGSPTGIVFGKGTAYPEKYQRALFICDWSYGNIYAVQLQPDGATYRGTPELFCSAPALQAADIVVGRDGAIYFVTGGRNTQSFIYRIKYVGNESTAPVTPEPINDACNQRRKLESIGENSGDASVAAVKEIWPQLSSSDRWIRFAARTALEKQPVAVWGPRLAAEKDNWRILQTVMAIARTESRDFLDPAVAALQRLTWDALDEQQRLDLIRDYALLYLRFGPQPSIAQAIVHQLDSHFPSGQAMVDRELARILAAVDAPSLVPRAIQLMSESATQEDQIHYALVLRVCHRDWSDDLRKQYFSWFLQAARLYGGNSFNGYIQAIRNEAIANLGQDERTKLASLLAQQPSVTDPYAELKARAVVKHWTAADLSANLESALEGRDLNDGRKMFVLAQCYKCHRFEGQGGFVGPDLTGVGRRYSRSDLLDSLVDPNKTVSDQYRSTRFLLTNGKTVVGRIVNLSGDNFLVETDMLNPASLTTVNIGQIDEQSPSKVSLMPEGLLDTLSKDEIYDLMAYLRSSQTFSINQ